MGGVAVPQRKEVTAKAEEAKRCSESSAFQGHNKALSCCAYGGRAITELLSKRKHDASQPSYTARAWTVTRGNLTLPATESLQGP